MQKVNHKNLDILRKQMQQAFRDFDTDHSGFIERHELSVMMKRLTGAFNVEEPSEEEINDILRDLDANGDGKVSMGEFETLVEEVISIIEEQ